MSEDRLMYTAGPMTTTSFGKPVVVASEEFVAKRVKASLPAPPAKPGASSNPAEGLGSKTSARRLPEYAELSRNQLSLNLHDHRDRAGFPWGGEASGGRVMANCISCGATVAQVFLRERADVCAAVPRRCG